MKTRLPRLAKTALKSTLKTAALGALPLLYGALREVDRLTADRRTLPLPQWPKNLDQLKIGLLSDNHIRFDRTNTILTRAALSWLKDQNPDLLLLTGDIANKHAPGLTPWLEFALEDLAFFAGRAYAVPGNRDYKQGDPDLLRPVLDPRGCRLLRNQLVTHQTPRGPLQILGVDSGNANAADPYTPLRSLDPDLPCLTLWHEPDFVDHLPCVTQLMLSGHSHGGQFLAPWGWAPHTTRNGSRYVRGFYPNAPTPIYVSRGLGTTGPPSRLFCPPEVTLLTLTRKS